VSTLLRTLVRLFPKPFRARFGQEVVEHALLDWERDMKRGPIAAVRCLASTVLDLGESALAERLRPTCPSVPAQKKGQTMSFDLNGWAGALRHALRTLRRSPGFATVAVLTLALGIGATTAIYSVVDTILLQPLPFADADRLAFC